MTYSDTPEFAAPEWRAFVAELERLQCAPADDDQLAMHESDDADLRGWVDDLEARLGFNVDRLRPLMEPYIAASRAEIRAMQACGDLLEPSEAEALQALKSAGYGVELRESNRLPLLVYPSEKRGTFWPMGCGSLFCASATDAHRYLIAGGAA